MAHYEKHGKLVCESVGDKRWYGRIAFNLINLQQINKVIVKYVGDRRLEGVSCVRPLPDFQVRLYGSEKAASPEPFDDDDLYLVMSPLLSADGMVMYFAVYGNTFQDFDVPLTEVFGKLWLVVTTHGCEEPPEFLVAVGGDVPGAVTHNSTVCLA